MSVATGENPSAVSHEQQSAPKPTDVIVGKYDGENDHIIRNRSEGMYIAAADTESSRSYKYASTLANNLDQRFSLDDPRGAFEAGVAEIYQSRDDTFTGLDPDLAAFKLYTDKDSGALQAVYLTSGNTDMYIENDGKVEKIKKPPTQNGNSESAPAIGMITLKPGDRIIAGTGGKKPFKNDNSLREIVEDKRHVRKAKPQNAVDYIKGKGFDDASLLVIDVARGSNAKKDGMMQKLGLRGREDTSRSENDTDDSERKGRMAGLLGAAALGGGLLFSKKKRQEHRERKEQERIAARERAGLPKPITYSEARQKGNSPIAAARISNSDRWRDNRQLRGSRRIDGDGDRDRSGNAKWLALGVLAVAGGLILKKAGFDIVPSGEHFWPDALGDRDGVDFSPVEGGFINGPNSWFGETPDGWFTDELVRDANPDIDEPVDDLGLGGADPDVDLPDPDVDLNPDPDVDLDLDPEPTPPVLDTDPDVDVETTPAWEPEAGDGITDYMHDREHELIGENAPNRTYQAYELIEERLNAGSLEVAGSDKPALYQMANGDWGISVHHARVQWDAEVQNLIDQAIRDVHKEAA